MAMLQAGLRNSGRKPPLTSYNQRRADRRPHRFVNFQRRKKMNFRFSWSFTLAAILGILVSTVQSSQFNEDEVGAVIGQISRVTLYRGQALVTRSIPLEGAKGAQEIVIGELPYSILDGSLFADSTIQVEVRAVRFRQRAVGEEPREEVKALDQRIAESQKSIQLNSKKQELANQKLVYLDQLQGFVAPTAITELTQGVLNAETLKQLTEFSFDQRSAIADQQVELAKEASELAATLQLLNRQRAELTSSAQKTVNEAVLFVEKLDDSSAIVELNYLVSRCGWTPTYTIKASEDRSKVSVEYNALIEQLTGENWNNVQLTLSTASPSLSASGPSLAPFAVTLESGQNANAQMPMAATWSDREVVSRLYSDNRIRQRAANVQLGQSVDFNSKTSGNWTVNILACQTQGMELSNPLEVISSITAESNEIDPPSINYPLNGSVSLNSRNDQQMVRIYSGNLPSGFYHVATPLLSSYVFREAEVNNASDHDFLGGPVTVYLEGRFVGRAEIPTVAQGESFVLGFGSDAQLRVRRELVDKKDGIRGGNNELKLAYRLGIENYKKKAIQLRLFDRLPYSEKPADIRVTLGKLTTDLSTDPVYLRRERAKNILRWDVEVPAEAIAESSSVIEYDFTLDHDRNFAIADASNEKAQEEFQKLERARQKR
jgi:hypothetical protein